MTLSEDRATGALWAIRFESGEGVSLSDQKQHDCLDIGAGWSWMHFPLSDQRGRRFLTGLALLPPPVRESLLGGEHRMQINMSEGWVYGVLPDLERDFDGHAIDIGRLNFALNEHYFFTTRRRALRGVDEVRRSIEQGLRLATPVDLFVMLIDRFVDLAEARQHTLATELDSIEDRVLSFDGDPSRLHVGPLRRELSRQHREFLALRATFQRAVFHRGQSYVHLLSDRLPALTQQLEDFDREAADLLERARLLHDEIGQQTDAAANRSLRALAILSTLLMPPTLVVGAFGMNLQGITWAHDPNGFAIVCGFCFGAIGISYLFLRTLKIL